MKTGAGGSKIDIIDAAIDKRLISITMIGR
jgi:hypothetical protein